MGYMRRLLESLPWWKLRPAPYSPRCTAGSGTPDAGQPHGGRESFLVDAPHNGPEKVRAALAEDGSCALVYTPQGLPFSLRLTALSPRLVRERWFNPRYGTLHPIHTGASRSYQTYAPPTSGDEQDWVLVLDEA